MKAESNHACLDGFARGSLEDGEGEEEVCDEDGHCTLDAMARSVKSRVGRVVCNKELLPREMTTADVVDSPTPFAPPWVVIPQEQLTLLMMAPKTIDLKIRAKMSDFCKAFDAESRMTLGPTSYTKSNRPSTRVEETESRVRAHRMGQRERERERGGGRAYQQAGQRTTCPSQSKARQAEGGQGRTL